jgi:beta-aspartyl-peptidase (threonine type)
MEGHTQRAGAIAGVTTVRHPIQLARAVMEHSKHVMLAGEGAEAFRRHAPEIVRVRNDWFDTDVRRRQLEKAQAAEKTEAAAACRDARRLLWHRRCGRAGCAWPYRRGDLDRRHDQQTLGPGRRLADHRGGHVGRRRCGVSGTGWGEFYIRFAVARDICARVAYRGDTLATAAEDVVNGSCPRPAATAVRSRSMPTATSRCRSTPRACIAAGSGRTVPAGSRCSATKTEWSVV